MKRVAVTLACLTGAASFAMAIAICIPSEQMTADLAGSPTASVQGAQLH